MPSFSATINMLPAGADSIFMVDFIVGDGLCCTS